MEPVSNELFHRFSDLSKGTGYSLSDHNILSPINPTYDDWLCQIYEDLCKLFWNPKLTKLVFWISENLLNLRKSDKISGILG